MTEDVGRSSMLLKGILAIPINYGTWETNWIFLKKEINIKKISIYTEERINSIYISSKYFYYYNAVSDMRSSKVSW